MVLRHIPLRGVSSLNLLCSCQCEDWNHPPLTLHVICPKTFRFDQFFQLWTWRRLGIYSGGEITIFISIAVGVAFTYPSLKTTLAGLAIINFREIFTSQDSFPWSGIIAQKIKSIQKLPNLFHYFRLRAKYDFVKKGGIWQHEKIHSSDDLHTFEFFRRAFSSMIPFFKKKAKRDRLPITQSECYLEKVSRHFPLGCQSFLIRSSQARAKKPFGAFCTSIKNHEKRTSTIFFCTINNSSLDPRHLLSSSDMSPTL